ncbi:Borealin [Liparis tanakae]|uniref:Borealin n=1 Tax=Liparis tanakae TaxID=230148 RepID=A0A4Z2EYY9_9TELE|nr:Borealin [Liparis tanakae]
MLITIRCRIEQPSVLDLNLPVEQRREEAAVVDSVVAEDHAVLLKSVKKTSKKRGGAKSSSGDEIPPPTTRKAKATRKPPPTSKRAKALAASMQNASIRRSSRKMMMVTPARSLLDASLMMGPTPLVTPRFDPRLPKTPAVRIPRHKERVYSISVNGSPIASGNQDIVINVPIGNGESVQLLASQMDSVDLSLLDENALRSIRLLKNRLTTLCGTADSPDLVLKLWPRDQTFNTSDDHPQPWSSP